MPTTGNKGEWSEIYVLLRLLSDLKLFSADENLNKTDSFLNIISIKRNDNGEFKYFPQRGNVNVIDASTNETIFSISTSELSVLSKKIFNQIKAGRGSSFSMSSSVQNDLKDL